MRGVGVAPVMSPMSKYRKRERSASKTRKSGDGTVSSGDAPAAKRQKLDSQVNASTAKAGNGNTSKKTSCNPRASVDTSSNRTTFTVRAPKIFKVTAGENNHGSNSPVANSSSHPSNASQTQPSVSSPSFSKTPDQAQQQVQQQQTQQPEHQAQDLPRAARRRRRPYLDVNLSEDDATRILGYRIKVWWPLDRKWYTGDVRDYDSVQQRHWIIYDDGDEEWVSLAEECFKLQLVPGDNFERASTGSTYRLRGCSKGSAAVEDHSSAVGADAGSDHDENPSSRIGFEDNKMEATTDLWAKRGSVGKPLSVYTRRRKGTPAGSSVVTLGVAPTPSTENCDFGEVQSPKEPGPTQAPAGTLQDAFDGPGLGPNAAEQVAKDAVQVDATGVPPGLVVEDKVDGSVVGSSVKLPRQPGVGTVYIDRWPLSRNIAQLLRHIEVWSGGDRGTLVGGVVLNQVWRGLQPVWNIGSLFGLKFGTSTELRASGTQMQGARMLGMDLPLTSDGNSIYMLHIDVGPVFSSSLSCEPPSCKLLLDSILRGRETNMKQRLSERTHMPYAGHSSKVDPQKPRVSLASNLRQIFKSRWKELGKRGLQLTFPESAALLSSQHVSLMFRVERLNREANPDESEDYQKLDGPTDDRVGVHELLSLSKKGRRSVPKGQKRGPVHAAEDGYAESQQPLAKRVRIDEHPIKLEECEEPRSYQPATPQGNILKLTRCPSRKGMWCVVDSSSADLELNQSDAVNDSSKKRLLEYSIDDEDIGEYEQDLFDDLDGPEMGEVETDPGTSYRSRSFDRRKRRRTESRRSTADYDPSPCYGNLLIVQSDRGWRERGATIELQSDGKAWALTVSLNGEVLYSYKATQRINHGNSNKYTHAMMWRGGKDWILELTDKQQWSQFRFMHDVCCDRNARALSVRHIPIPGVREIVETDPAIKAYFRPEQYIRTLGEMDAALTTDRVLYDLDLDDERWLLELNTGRDEEAAVLIPEQLEKIIHQLERGSYLRSEEISQDDAFELCAPFAPADIMNCVYSYWMEKRKQRGAPLIRCFQPPAWEEYEALLQAWEESKRHPVTRQHASQPQKPTLFAFCLKPKGLDVPNRPQRQRSQRRLMSRPLNPFDSSQFDYSDHPFLDSPKSRDTVYLSPSYASLGQEKPTEGSPGLDIVDDGVYPPRIITKYRSKTRKPGRKPRRMKYISEEAKPLRATTFIAPSTAVSLDNGGYVEQMENDSCSSLELDFNDEAVAAKAAYARKMARIAAAKAARAQELYAIADAAMNKAVSCLIEAEAIAAVERAAKEQHEQQLQQQMGLGFGGDVEGMVMHGFGDADGSDDRDGVEDEVLLLPIGGSCWTQEFGSGLIQKSPLEAVQSPRKGMRYMSLSSSSSGQPLFRGMVS